jgi:hypothetical protein
MSARSAPRVTVCRGGGFAGRVVTSTVDPATHPAGGEIAELAAGLDLADLPATAPQPDRYYYTISIGDHELTVQEQDLSPDLARLVALVLDSPGFGTD